MVYPSQISIGNAVKNPFFIKDDYLKDCKITLAKNGFPFMICVRAIPWILFGIISKKLNINSTRALFFSSMIRI